MAIVQGAFIQSGYPVIADYGASELDTTARIYGVGFPGGIRKGAVATVLLYVAGRWHTEVEPLRAGQCWGYDRRNIRGGAGWSNHAGGAAIDINASLHPQHRATLSPAQLLAAGRIRNDCGGVTRWGMDWDPSSLDQMHVEIGLNLAGSGRVEAFALEIETGRAPNTPPELIRAGEGPINTTPAPAPAAPARPAPKPAPPSVAAPAFPLPGGYYYGPKSGPKQSISGSYKTDTAAYRAGLKLWQQRMRGRGWKITPDGYYGPVTEHVARAFQTEKHLYVDGLIGAVTFNAAWTAPVT